MSATLPAAAVTESALPAQPSPKPARPKSKAPGASSLRTWQREALEMYLRRCPRDFLAVATPGAGKTTFALHVAAGLLMNRLIDQIVVVAPTEHLKYQWADAAARVGLPLDPDFSNRHATTTPDFGGIVVTYAQVAAAPEIHAAGVGSARTLVILDECHHAGDAKSWGDGVRIAYEPAAFRLHLSGTPWRSDANQIPFITYEEDGDGQLISKADYTYGYAQALADGVVRPVVFMAYGGQARWLGREGQLAADLSDPGRKPIRSAALRTALSPTGAWVPEVLAAADARLTQVRQGGMPDAAGLVIATSKAHARAYADFLAGLTGTTPTVVLSDDPKSSDQIAAFSASTNPDDRWLVSVRMVSEGVDVARLAVGAYLTTSTTPLFFTQAVGRFVRARRRGETATVFLPATLDLTAHASEMERQRDHVIAAAAEATGEDPEVAIVEAAQRLASNGDTAAFEALDAIPEFGHALFAGEAFAPGSGDVDGLLELPPVIDPEEVAALLRARGAAAAQTPVMVHRAMNQARRDLQALVGAFHHRSGMGHAQIHAELRRGDGGPPTPAAPLTIVQDRVRRLREWMRG